MLIITGGLIGALSSLATLAAVYLLEGMRLRRKWRREDELLLRSKRAEIDSLLSSAFTQKASNPNPQEPDSVA